MRLRGENSRIENEARKGAGSLRHEARLDRQPEATYDKCCYGGAAKYEAITIHAMLKSGNDLADEPGEPGHRDDAADSEGEEIGQRIRGGGEAERWEDAEEM